MKYISSIDRNLLNAIVIYGAIGKRIYYYYTKQQAIKLYNKEAKEKKQWATFKNY